MHARDAGVGWLWCRRRLDHLNAFLDVHVAHTSFDRRSDSDEVRIEHGGDHLDFAVRVEIDQVDNVVGHRSADLIAEDLFAQGLHRGRVSSRYADVRTPRSGRSARFGNDGTTLRSSVSMRSA